MELRYDRQLRLWGTDGQRALAVSHIFILGATTTAAEILKNLILPGISHFTIVDNAIIHKSAVGNNFFLTMEDYTARLPIAEALVRHLRELNRNNCVGNAVLESCEAWVEMFISQQESIEDKGKRRKRIITTEKEIEIKEREEKEKEREELENIPTLIVATPKVSAASLRRLAVYLKNETNIPLVYVQTTGLTGLIHIQEKERLIIHTEPKPETLVEDLRIFNPFPALQQWFITHNPEDKTLFEYNLELHSHIPWITILYHALQRVRRESGNLAFIPRNKADYDEIKKVIYSFIRRPSPPQEGFMEALEKCRTVLNRPLHLPDTLQHVLDDPRAEGGKITYNNNNNNNSDNNNNSESFERISPLCWAVIRGIKRFIIDNNGIPPFCGYVPDITTTTQWYSELTAIYTEKMEEDCTRVFEYALEELINSGIDSDKTCVMELTKALVRNLWTLQLINFSPDLDEEVWVSLQQERFTQYFESCSTDGERFTVELYAALLAARYFEEQHGRVPGSIYEDNNNNDNSDNNNDKQDIMWKDDAKELLRIVEASREGSNNYSSNSTNSNNNNNNNNDNSNSSDLTLKACMEVARFGGGEPAFTACIIGAAAAQECIKLIQHRRVPIQRPLVFDGYRSCFWLVPPVSKK